MPLHNIEGDLLAQGYDYIVQQGNCLAVRSHGLSKQIANRWPHSDVYAGRKPVGKRNLAQPADREPPGTMWVQGGLITFWAQWRPGKVTAPYFSRYPESDPPETSKQREIWFQECLDHLAEYLEGNDPWGKRIGFPHGIGCGMAGGDWLTYQAMLESFSDKTENQIYIIKLPSFF